MTNGNVGAAITKTQQSAGPKLLTPSAVLIKKRTPPGQPRAKPPVTVAKAEPTSVKSTVEKPSVVAVAASREKLMPVAQTAMPTPSYQQFQSQLQSQPDKMPQIDDNKIDSALIAALRDQRERLGLLKLEKVMIDFMNSTDDFVEVGGLYNAAVVSPVTGVIGSANNIPDRPQTTFQRCILHRLADRFAILRENGSLVDGYIRLLKQPSSRIPGKLLLHLETSQYTDQTADAARSFDHMTISGTSKPTGVHPSSSGKVRSKKMKIMKRSSSGDSSRGSSNGNGNSKGGSRKGKNYADKEKAYAEARARIFSDQNGGESSMPPLQDQAASFPAVEVAAPISGTTAGAPNLSDNDPAPRAQTVAIPVGKATYRNRQQEENDPDFQRGNAVVLPMQPTYANDVYKGNYPNNLGHFPSHATSSQNMYQQQQQQHHHHHNEDGSAHLPSRDASNNGTQQQQQQQLQNYYAGAIRDQPRGNVPIPRYGETTTNNFHARSHANNYRSPTTPTSTETTNVNSLEDFPSLR